MFSEKIKTAGLSLSQLSVPPTSSRSPEQELINNKDLATALGVDPSAVSNSSSQFHAQVGRILISRAYVQLNPNEAKATFTALKAVVEREGKSDPSVAGQINLAVRDFGKDKPDVQLQTASGAIRLNPKDPNIAQGSLVRKVEREAADGTKLRSSSLTVNVDGVPTADAVALLRSPVSTQSVTTGNLAGTGNESFVFSGYTLANGRELHLQGVDRQTSLIYRATDGGVGKFELGAGWPAGSQLTQETRGQRLSLAVTAPGVKEPTYIEFLPNEGNPDRAYRTLGGPNAPMEASNAEIAKRLGVQTVQNSFKPNYVRVGDVDISRDYITLQSAEAKETLAALNGVLSSVRKSDPTAVGRVLIERESVGKAPPTLKIESSSWSIALNGYDLTQAQGDGSVRVGKSGSKTGVDVVPVRLDGKSAQEAIQLVQSPPTPASATLSGFVDSSGKPLNLSGYRFGGQEELHLVGGKGQSLVLNTNKSSAMYGAISLGAGWPEGASISATSGKPPHLQVTVPGRPSLPVELNSGRLESGFNTRK